jgi:putative endonuclease
MSGKRQQAEARGRWAERLAGLWLRCKGYRILDRRARTAAGEVDLVACRGAVLAFIEVKARKDLDAAINSVSPRQRRRIIQAASLWRARYQGFSDLQPRFDLVVILPHRWPIHYRAAWIAEGRQADELI